MHAHRSVPPRCTASLGPHTRSCPWMVRAQLSAPTVPVQQPAVCGPHRSTAAHSLCSSDRRWAPWPSPCCDTGTSMGRSSPSSAQSVHTRQEVGTWMRSQAGGGGSACIMLQMSVHVVHVGAVSPAAGNLLLCLQVHVLRALCFPPASCCLRRACCSGLRLCRCRPWHAHATHLAGGHGVSSWQPAVAGGWPWGPARRRQRWCWWPLQMCSSKAGLKLWWRPMYGAVQG